MVVVASVAAAWLLHDESDPRADEALRLPGNSGGIVPEICHLEGHRALLGAERRGRLEPDDADRRLAGWEALPLRTLPTPPLGAVLGLARRRRLGVHDAIYLELAKRTGATLATLDRALLRAAPAEKAKVVQS